jgi:energy-coupling factor transport system ATP-binding protein
MELYMVQIKSLSFKYQGGMKPALSDINLAVPEGGFLGIIGASGAGKSTLLYAVNAAVPHHFKGDFYGEARVNGLDTVDAGISGISRQVGSVFEDIDAQMVASTVEDELLFGLENFNVPRGEIETRITEALSYAGISNLREREISSLSGGQKQKTAIAAITALRPKILTLDEPTGELDPRSSRMIYEHLKFLNESFGITIIVVEQKIMLLCEFAKHIAVMDKGKIVRYGTAAEVLRAPDELEKAGVHVPRVTSLGLKLREANYYDGDLPYNIPQAEAMVKKTLDFL